MNVKEQSENQRRQTGANVGFVTSGLIGAVSGIPIMIGEGRGPHKHVEGMIAQAKKKLPSLDFIPVPSVYSSFMPKENIVRYGGTATLAHELGHAAIYDKIKKMKMSGPYMATRALGIGVVPIGSMYYSAHTPDDKKAKNVALGATALSGLTVADEAAASAIGIKNIIKHEGGVGKFLTSKTMPKTLATLASGLGTYAAMASTPLLAYHFSRTFKRDKK